MKYVLDTNAIIAALNRVAVVEQRLRVEPAAEIGIPIVVMAELLYGAQRSKRSAENLERVRRLPNSFQTLPVTEAVTERYGLLRAKLEARGLPKSDFDLVIACTALEHGAILVTNDGSLKDGSIEGLTVEDWLEA